MGNTVIAFNWNPKLGTLAEFQTVSTLPAAFTGDNTAAEIEIHPNGKFLYASNRGNDTIAIFAIDQTNGRLTLVAHVPTQGKNPRNFAFDPTAKWLLCTNQDGNSAVVFKVDATTGTLTQTGQPVAIDAPCCERFVPVAKS
jgi:6-phosphogluconolactonase